jgi:threonine dehydrogenase-like Zn-dependent dehydrogenase
VFFYYSSGINRSGFTNDVSVTQGLKLGTGQCNVKAYNRYLRDLIISGRAKPSFVVSHEVELDEAPDAYTKFDRRVEGYTKVLIHPNGPL